MGQDGAVQIQGCAIRVSQLDNTGAPVVGASEMWADDIPFVKLERKPVYENGVDITPISACGQPTISYKDYDRPKRWDLTLTVAALDFERDSLIDGSSLLTRGSSTGRSVTDGVLVANSPIITSGTANFTNLDVGRVVTDTTTPGNIPANTVIISVQSAGQATLSAAAAASATTEHLSFGTIAAETIGLQSVPLLTVGNPNGVSIEVWAKAIIRKTGFQGSRPYPAGGSATTTPPLQGSGWVRILHPRAYLFPDAETIENKETQQMWNGWCIENPNWGTGPNGDWTTGGVANPGTGVALASNRAYNKMRDNGLPSPLQPGLQAVSV